VYIIVVEKKVMNNTYKEYPDKRGVLVTYYNRAQEFSSWAEADVYSHRYANEKNVVRVYVEEKE